MADNQQMDARKWIAVAGTMLGAFMAVLDIQITNASLADISGGIASTPDEGSWISTSYLIGEINIKGFSLGVGAVLFVALAVGWFAPKSVPAPMVGTIGKTRPTMGIARHSRIAPGDRMYPARVAV